ncbi:MAG TPA: mismatch-specific DNA-glycosylase [Polyangiaceae bacterium]|nr:mismatch-specific DNA-glycosylase [Polyangiaceae bacterium]
MVGSLPDIVAPDLEVLIVAINPSVRSAEAGYSFASKGNPFWRLLHESGLTPVLLKPEDGARLPEFGVGLISGVKRATRSAAELTRAEQALGAKRVARLAARLRPRYLALLGLTLYPVFFPGGDERGPGLKTSTVAGARVFVLPNPSGLNRAYPGFAKKLVWFQALASLLGR